MSGPSPISTLDFESKVRALLAQEKWRQARDELKTLVKSDRPRFLPLLVEANIGLARKMIAGGQISEARQVLSYLATIAPPEQYRGLELEIGVKSGGGETLLPKMLSELARPQTSLPEAAQIALADTLVLAFSSAIPSAPASPEESRLRTEMRAVHEALEAFSEANWPRVSERLRQIPHRSPFSHWTVFLKGLTAFHAGDLGRAVKLWRNLPLRSVPGKASQPYLVLAGDPLLSEAPGAESTVGGICRITGAGELASPLLQAEKLWRKDRLAESYEAIRNLVPSFPSTALDAVGVLTEFYFNATHTLIGENWTVLLRCFVKLLDRNASKNETEVMLTHRALALRGKELAPVDELRASWKEYLFYRERLRGRNPRLSSIANAWLGEQLSAPSSSYRRHGDSRMRDAEGAIEALVESIDLDPANLEAHLRLCTVYEALKKRSERNRLLDLMTSRFPDNQKVLVAAGRECIERKAFVKGLDYLTRARQHDQLDPEIPKLLVIGLEAMAREQFQKGQTDKARRTLERTEEWLTDEPEDFQRSRWSAWSRQAAVEARWGEAALSADLIARATARAPSSLAPRLLADLTYRHCAKTHVDESPFLKELRAGFAEPLALREIALLLRLLQTFEETAQEFSSGMEEMFVGQAIWEALKRPFAVEDALPLIKSGLHRAGLQEPIDALLARILRDDPQHPAYRLWRLVSAGYTGLDPVNTRTELKSIIEEAARRKDQPTLARAREMLREIEEPAFDSPWGDEEDEFDDFDEDDDGDLPDETAMQMAEILTFLQRASPAEIRAFRKKVTQVIPLADFDAMVELAKKGPPPLPPSSPKGKAARPVNRPAQGELF